MGQKVNPHGLRVGVIKDWDSRWYASEEKVGDLIVEDQKIRKYLKKTLYSAGIPDPELIIRPSGELRLSNFLLWQAAYAELFFTPVLWPDFTEEDFAQALDEYARRERRFGLVKNNERN